MSDSHRLQSEHSSDDHVEIVDLDRAEANAGDGNDDAARTSRRGRLIAPMLPLPFWRRKRVQIATTSIVLLAALIVLLSVSGSFSWLAAQAQPDVTTQPAPTQVGAVYTPPPSSQQDGLACLVDAAWSLDSKQVAVLGYAQNCPLMPGPLPSLQVNVYNGVSQKLNRQVQLNAMILPALKQRGVQSASASSINFGSIAWSPDGQQLAISFTTDEVGTVYDGILLLAPNGQEHRVMLWPDNRQNSSSSYLEWDLTRGAPRVIYYSKQLVSPSQQFAPANLQLAPAYRWEVGGRLEPVSQVSDTGGSIGNSDGDPMFTVWQPGFASLITQQPPLGPTLPVKFLTWGTQFAAWSPDGRYFIDQVYTIGRFMVPRQPSPSHQELVSLGMDQLPTLNIRDKALGRLLAALLSGHSSSEIYIVWRPDGRELATYASGRVEIYDCATGRKLASLLPSNKPADLNGGETFSWSPDGSRLMLSSSTWGVLTVWGPGQLPG